MRQVRIDHRVVVPLADLPAGVAGRAHHDVLADFGVVQQAVADQPEADGSQRSVRSRQGSQVTFISQWPVGTLLSIPLSDSQVMTRA
jgi:hypothetical protein